MKELREHERLELLVSERGFSALTEEEYESLKFHRAKAVMGTPPINLDNVTCDDVNMQN
jgi:hypothetical protein